VLNNPAKLSSRLDSLAGLFNNRDIRSFHCERQPPLHLIPSSQHSLLPLPIDAAAANTSNNHVPLAPSEIQKTFLESGINKVAFIRHGNTATASNDFERALTELGRSQS